MSLRVWTGKIEPHVYVKAINHEEGGVKLQLCDEQGNLLDHGEILNINLHGRLEFYNHIDEKLAIAAGIDIDERGVIVQETINEYSK